MKIGRLLSSFFDLINPRSGLSAGLSVENEEYQYVLVSRKAGQRPGILAKKTGVIGSLKAPLFCGMHADMGDFPVMLVTENIGDADPDQWIDQNEARVIPTGITSNEIVNEWAVQDKTIYSGTVSKKTFEQVFSGLHADRVLLSSLSVPLWNLGRLYSHHTIGSFVIWKISKQSSILGLVENHSLCRLCNFWLGFEDLEQKPEEACGDLCRIIQSLCADKANVPVFFLYPKARFELAEVFKKSGIAFENPPEIPGVSLEFHEAYANALHEDTHLDFRPFGHVQDSHRLAIGRKRSLTVFHAFIKVLIAVAVVLVCVKAGSIGIGHYLGAKAGPVKEHMEKYRQESRRIEALSKMLEQKNRFINQKSSLTFPVTEMQTAFPEGVWAEEISFSEANESSWNCAIMACSYSSGLIPGLLKNLSEMKGMGNVRMIYSEQGNAIRGKPGERVVKLRIEAIWKILQPGQGTGQ
jgi:hypothetical protein